MRAIQNQFVALCLGCGALAHPSASSAQLAPADSFRSNAPLTPGTASTAPAPAAAAPAAPGPAPPAPAELSVVDPSSAQLQQADELYRAGNRALDERRWMEAYDAYRRSWQLKQSFDIAGNLGSVELTLGKSRDAAEHLSYSLRHLPVNAAAEVRQKAQRRLSEARSNVGTLVVRSNVDGTEILIDGVRAGSAPLDDVIFVEAGTRRIEAKAAGYVVRAQNVRAAAGITQNVHFTLVGAQSVDAADSLEPSKARGGRSLAPIYAGAGLMTLGLAGGVVFTVLSMRKSSEAEVHREAILQRKDVQGSCLAATSELAADCQGLADADDRRRVFGNLAIGSFVGAGIAGVVTLYYALKTTSKPDSSGIASAPLLRFETHVTPDAAFATVRGAWQ